MYRNSFATAGTPSTKMGYLRLEFSATKTGKSRLVHQDRRFPLHFTTPFFLDDGVPNMAFAYVQNPSGAVFSGDNLSLKVRARDGAKVHVTNTSATKLHRMPDGGAFQEVYLSAAAGSYIEYHPDQLIPQAGSHFTQKTVLEIEHDGVLLCKEEVAPGRTSRGENFAYSELNLETRIAIDGHEALVERSQLAPAVAPLNIVGVFGDFRYSGRIIALAPKSIVEGLLESISTMRTSGQGFKLGFGMLPGEMGIQVRAIAHSSIGLRSVMDSVWARLRTRLAGSPPPTTRK